MYIYLIITVAVVIFAAVATIMIGNSTENREGNPSYDKKAAQNWIRITVVYAISIALGLVVLLVFVAAFLF